LICGIDHPAQLDATLWQWFDEFEPQRIAEITQELTQQDLLNAVEGFEKRDTLKNMDMMDGDHDALVAGGDLGKASNGGGHDHNHDHSHNHDH